MSETMVTACSSDDHPDYDHHPPAVFQGQWGPLWDESRREPATYCLRCAVLLCMMRYFQPMPWTTANQKK